MRSRGLTETYGGLARRELTVRIRTSTMPLMAQRIVTELTDDTNGKPADETVTFGLDGREYEIDLTSKNAAALRKAFDVYVKNGRRVGGRRPRNTGGSSSSGSSGSSRSRG